MWNAYLHIRCDNTPRTKERTKTFSGLQLFPVPLVLRCTFAECIAELFDCVPVQCVEVAIIIYFYFSRFFLYAYTRVGQ